MLGKNLETSGRGTLPRGKGRAQEEIDLLTKDRQPKRAEALSTKEEKGSDWNELPE